MPIEKVCDGSYDCSNFFDESDELCNGTWSYFEKFMTNGKLYNWLSVSRFINTILWIFIKLADQPCKHDEKECKNNGTCLIRRGHPYCMCSIGFGGSMCQYIRSEKIYTGKSFNICTNKVSESN